MFWVECHSPCILTGKNAANYVFCVDKVGGLDYYNIRYFLILQRNN